MDAILLFSHGSVLCGAERNLVDLAARMKARGDAPFVEPAYLNYNEPRFADAVDHCVAAGASRIIVAPYFLIEGKFVVQDLPERIAEARVKHPGVEFVTAGVIGFHEAMAEAVAASAAAAKPPLEWRDTIAESAKWCRMNPKCPIHGIEPCRYREAQ